MAEKQTQADYYNQKAKQLQDLKQYQNVRVELNPKKPIWQKATVVQQPTDRSLRRYQVQTESGARYFRNRRYLRPEVQSDRPTRRSNRAACHFSRINCANIITRKYRQPDIADTVCRRPHPSQYCNL